MLICSGSKLRVSSRRLVKLALNHHLLLNGRIKTFCRQNSLCHGSVTWPSWHLIARRIGICATCKKQVMVWSNIYQNYEIYALLCLHGYGFTSPIIQGLAVLTICHLKTLAIDSGSLVSLQSVIFTQLALFSSCSEV